MMRVDAKVNDMIKIGKNVSIKIEHKSGQISRLSIVAPKELKIELVKGGDALALLDQKAIGIVGA